jgi:hypothetical protein
MNEAANWAGVGASLGTMALTGPVGVAVAVVEVVVGVVDMIDPVGYNNAWNASIATDVTNAIRELNYDVGDPNFGDFLNNHPDVKQKVIDITIERMRFYIARDKAERLREEMMAADTTTTEDTEWDETAQALIGAGGALFVVGLLV